MCNLKSSGVQGSRFYVQGSKFKVLGGGDKC